MSTPPPIDSFIESNIRYNAKVIIPTGFTDVLNKSGKNPATLIKFLVAKQDRNNLKCIGGEWSPALDGGNPADGDDALIKTAIRYAKQQIGLDLTNSSSWIRFIEIHYLRPSTKESPEQYTEITVIFLPNVASVVPTKHHFVSDWDERHRMKRVKEKEAKRIKEEEKAAATTTEPQNVTATSDTSNESVTAATSAVTVATDETATNVATSSSGSDVQNPVEGVTNEGPTEDEEYVPANVETTSSGVITEPILTQDSENEKFPEPPKVVGLLITPDRHTDVITISLSGLLEYNENDKREETFEVSLFAEAFSDMLQREYGNMILRCIEDYHEDKQLSEKKRRREESEGISGRTRTTGFSDAPPATSVTSGQTSVSSTSDDSHNNENQYEPDVKKIKEETPSTGLEPTTSTSETSVTGEEDEEYEPMPVVPPLEDISAPQLPPPQNNLLDLNETDTTAMTLSDTNSQNVVNESDDKNVIHFAGGAHHEVKPIEPDVNSAEISEGVPPEQAPHSTPASVLTPLMTSSTSTNPPKEEKIILPPPKKKIIDERLLQAFQYFDRSTTGYVTTDDLEIVLHSLGYHFSYKHVHQLINKVMDSQFKRVYYRRLTEKEVAE